MTNAQSEQEKGEELKNLLPRIKGLSPQESLKTFKLDPKVKIKLYASEPLVIDPIAMAFAPDGSAFVVEMRDYPFIDEPNNLTHHLDAKKQPAGRIRHLIDDDRDGQADRSIVFADQLTWPTGIALYRDQVLVTAAPDLISFRDTDGDGKADEKKVLWTGFGRRNVQALLNGMKWGPDNFLYLATGYNGGIIHQPGKKKDYSINARGNDIRFHPEGSTLELIPTGGQYGLDVSSIGERFICSNSRHLRHVIIDGVYLNRSKNLSLSSSVIDIGIDGGAAPVFRTSQAEPWRLVRTRWRANSKDASRFPKTELVPIGYFTSATGLHVYEGSGLPPKFKGNVFIGDVGGNLVHRKVLYPNGSTYSAKRPQENVKSEFLTSTDNWFRPAFITTGPDDALYVCDMYRETIEHPYSIPQSIKQHLHLTSGNDRGRIWRIVKATVQSQPMTPNLKKLSSKELTQQLGSPNSWLRETSLREVLERKDDSVIRELQSIFSVSPHSTERYFVLQALIGLKGLNESLLNRALNDSDSRVSQHAIRATEKLEPLSFETKNILLKLVDSPRLKTQLQLALSAGEWPTDFRIEMVKSLSRKPLKDPWIKTAILSSVSGIEAEVYLKLFGGPDKNWGESIKFAEPLAEAVANSKDRSALITLVNGLKTHLNQESPNSKKLIQSTLKGTSKRSGKSGSSLLSLLKNRDAESFKKLSEKLNGFYQKAANDANEDSLSLKQRREAIRFLANGPQEIVLDALKSLLNVNKDPALQLEALQALSKRSEIEVSSIILQRFSQMSPGLKREAIELLFRRLDRLQELLTFIEEEKIPASDIDPDRKLQLLRHPDKKIKERSNKLFQQTQRDRQAVIKKYRSALTLKGSPEKGKALFTKHCGTCHQLAGLGKAVGPDLATVKNRGKEALLTQILDPNREVLPTYINYQAITRDSQVISGMLVAESANSITLRRAEGAEDTLLRKDLISLESQGSSLMPEGLEESISPQDLADILDFILNGK